MQTMERVREKKKKKEGANRLQRFLAWDWCLLVSCFIGVVIGFVIGFVLYYFKASSHLLLWVGLPGELYMRMLKAAVLPLIISSIITGTAGLKPKENGKVSAVALTYIVFTNVMGAVVGTVLAVIIRPGVSETSVSASSASLDTGHLGTADLFADLIRNLVPDNIVTACFEKSQTHYKPVPIDMNNSTGVNTTNITSASPPETFERYVSTSSGTNVLGLIIVCTVLGMASGQAGEDATPFLKFFKSSTDVILLLIQWLIKFTPVGAVSLIASAVGKSSDMEETFRGLGFFVLAQVVGYLVLVMVMLPLLYFIFLRRRHPLVWMLGTTRAILAAAVSGSSIVAMPELLKCVENRHGVDKRISSFVIPMGCSLNRDGSAMFISLTCLFMAQVQGVATADIILMITILAAVGSLAVPSMPSASIVTTLMIVTSLGVSPANLGILLALEWFSDRARVMPNAYSHVVCCLITWHVCKSSLQRRCPEEDGSGCLDFCQDQSLEVLPPHNDASSKKSSVPVKGLEFEDVLPSEEGDSESEKIPLEGSVVTA